MKAKNGDPHAIKDLVYKPLGNSIEEITEAYDMMYQKTKEKIDGLASQVGVPLRDTTNSQSQYIKTKEKINDVIGIKPIRVPEVKQGNNDIKVPPQNVTFSPQVNVNMGGVVIKNEVDVEKVAELSKQKIIKNLMNHVQTTK